MIGQVFGKWTVLQRHDARRVLCRCNCGTEKPVRSDHLRNGFTKSCGCRDTPAKSSSNEYQSWRAMVTRCTNPKAANYYRYGGRGIAICSRWLDSFENFLADMGRRPDLSSLDRIDNYGGYEPTNCRWATAAQQANNRRDNRLITVDGVTRTLQQWSDATGLAGTLGVRLNNGWDVSDALRTPAARYGRSLLFGYESMSMSKWADHIGIPLQTLSKRLRSGWSLERALTEKVNVKKRNKRSS